MNTTIRTNQSNSKTSSNINNVLNLDLTQTSRVLPHEMFFDTVDLYSIFTKEREVSDNYRLIVTINPILTNVLFNTNTEIIKNEGGKDVVLIDNRINVKDGLNEDTKEVVKIYGDKTPNRIKMVENTEYSKKWLDYQYHCGFDIFNNHLLRSVAFKCVNMPNKEGDVDFNTIRDFMRYNNGDDVIFNRRIDISTKPELNLKKHLYDYEDILTIDDSINNNLIEEDGWFGFTNGMKINTKKVGSLNNGTIYKETLDINKPMNNLNSCEFIDMYPDRSLFSFIPKINKIQKRLEYNWHYCLTYPYKNTKNHTLIYGNGVNGLKCQYVIKIKGYNGNDVFLFRMLLPHNLNPNDRFILYSNSNKFETPLTVTDIGDVNKKNKTHMFYVTGNEIQENLGLTGSTYDKAYVLNEAMNASNEFRIRKLVGDFESEYYIRIFRKLPNLRYAKELPTDENIDNITEELIANKQTNFDSTLYKLGFASTIYNEKSAQITFTDDINISSLKDNLGRPLSDIFLTIVKNNKGWNNWYGDVIQEGITANGCILTIGSYDKTVSNNGSTVKIPIYSKTDIGDSIGWVASNGQTGSDGDNLILTIPPCNVFKEDGGCSYSFSVSGVSTEGFSCSQTIELIQIGIDKIVPDCDDCRVYHHTVSGIHGLNYKKQNVTFIIYHSCFKNIPMPWQIDVIDRETGKSATWVDVLQPNGNGRCCPEWDACGPFNGEAKKICIDNATEKSTVVIDENKTTKDRTADIRIKIIGGCTFMYQDYITQKGNPISDDCPKKYAMFKDSRTITNFPSDGTSLKEGLNIYCKPNDVTPTFDIKGASGVTSKLNGDGTVSFNIPENPSETNRTIIITVHPNIDTAKTSVNSGDIFVRENSIVFKNGDIYSDYTDEETEDITVISDFNEEIKENNINEVKINDFSIIKNRNDVKINKERNERAILDIEYSHCFGKITSGFKLMEHLSVPDKNNEQHMTINIMESDVTLLHNIKSYKNQSSRELENNITIEGSVSSTVSDEIGNNNGLFLGDVVEFNKIDANETVLDGVYHRFNTTQRETVFSGNTTLNQFHWSEFVSDDYDSSGFKVVATATTVDEQTNLRPEGYFYKPHYRIPVRELSTQVFQDSVLKIIPVSTTLNGDSFMQITTNQKHHLKEGENVHIVILDKDKNDIEDYICSIYSVINEIKFVLNFKGVNIGYGSLASGLINGNIELRKNNENIPRYAFPLKDGSGRYLWRTVNRIGDINNSILREEDYPFTNNAFYYNKNINFFLRRQDPHNTKGLYTDSKFPNDVIGTIKPENKYNYVNEKDIVC